MFAVSSRTLTIRDAGREADDCLQRVNYHDQ